MAVAQIYTAAPGDTITAARWNNEFGNIYNNGTTLAFPATANVSMNGFSLFLDTSGLVKLTGDTGAGVLTGDFSVTGNMKANAAPGFFIQGLTTANNGGDPINSIDIAIGMATSDDAVQANRRTMTLSTAMTKKLNGAWSVGTTAGGLDTGLIGNSNYYIWLIMRPDTGVVDALFSLSPTAPTMPASYTYKRLIGWIIRTAGTIVAFNSYEMEGGGLQVLWGTPPQDLALSNTLTTTRRTDALSVPLNFSTLAHIVVEMNDASALFISYLSCPDSVTGVNANMVRSPAINSIVNMPLNVRTSASGTIAAISNLATVDVYNVWTLGFTWARRN